MGGVPPRRAHDCERAVTMDRRTKGANTLDVMVAPHKRLCYVLVYCTTMRRHRVGCQTTSK